MRQVLCLTVFVWMSSSAFGIFIQEFPADTPNGTVAADTYTITLPGLLADGVTFDATLTVTGTAQGGGAGTLTQTTFGLGVSGAGSNLVSDGELLTFSMTAFNFVGGSVAFNGFTEIDFNNFLSPDSGVLSLDNSAATGADNFFTTSTGASTVDISATLPTSFSAIASAGALNSFSVDDVSGQFTGSSIPEPSSFLLLGFVSLIGIWRVLFRPNRT